jgi:hypothetical protein
MKAEENKNSKRGRELLQILILLSGQGKNEHIWCGLKPSACFSTLPTLHIPPSSTPKTNMKRKEIKGMTENLSDIWWKRGKASIEEVTARQTSGVGICVHSFSGPILI